MYGRQKESAFLEGLTRSWVHVISFQSFVTWVKSTRVNFPDFTCSLQSAAIPGEWAGSARPRKRLPLQLWPLPKRKSAALVQIARCILHQLACLLLGLASCAQTLSVNYKCLCRRQETSAWHCKVILAGPSAGTLMRVAHIPLQQRWPVSHRKYIACCISSPCILLQGPRLKSASVSSKPTSCACAPRASTCVTGTRLGPSLRTVLKHTRHTR